MAVWCWTSGTVNEIDLACVRGSTNGTTGMPVPFRVLPVEPMVPILPMPSRVLSFVPL